MNEFKILTPSFLRPLPGENSSGENSLLFRLGETFRGRVLQQISPQNALLQLRGHQLLVESQVLLPPGVELQFRVEEIQPKVILRLLPPESPEEQKIYSLLKKYLSGDLPLDNLAEKLSALGKAGSIMIPPSAREPFQQFLTLLNRFPSPSILTADPGALARLVAQSGFFWENKIKEWIEGGGKGSLAQLIQEDIKGLGMKLLARWEDSSRPTEQGEENLPLMEDLKKGLEAWVKKIELYQILNLGPADVQERLSLFLPFWLGSNLQFVELNLSFPRKESGPAEGKELAVLFLLSLPDLGKIRIEVQIKEKDLFGRLMFSDSQASEFVEQALPDLCGRLKQLGYQPHIQLSVEPVEKMNETFVSDLERGSKALFSVII